MYRQVRDEEILLAEKLDISMSFDEDAVDEADILDIEVEGEDGTAIDNDTDDVRYFSRNLMCPSSGISYPNPEPNNFSFNSSFNIGANIVSNADGRGAFFQMVTSGIQTLCNLFCQIKSSC